MSTTEHSDELAELAKSLAAAQAEFTTIPKTDENPFFHSKYAGLPKVVEIASPILSKHGLSVSQFIGHDEQGDTLTTWLLHVSGQYIKGTMRLRPVKNDPQAQGSATTYARRYSYMSVLGLVADEDDDGNQASQGSARRSEAKPKPKASTRQQASSSASANDSAPAGKTETLQKLMLSELHGPQRPAFMTWLEKTHGFTVTAVPKDKVEYVEKVINQYAAGDIDLSEGRPFEDEAAS